MLRDPVDSTPEPDTPGVVLTCGDPACRHTFEPDPVVFATARLACPRCDGWTFAAELTEPAPAGGDRR